MLAIVCACRPTVAAFALLACGSNPPTSGAETTTEAETTSESGTHGSSSSVTQSSGLEADAGAETTRAADAESTTSPMGESTGDVCHGPGRCQTPCGEPIDCCQGGRRCLALLDEFPATISCERGVCVYHGCQADQHCESEIYDTCVIADGFGSCRQGCAADADCLAPTVCTGADGTYCEHPPCAADEECGQGEVCDRDTGDCIVGLECIDESSCFGSGSCVDGWCMCSCDEDCSGERICVPE